MQFLQVGLALYPFQNMWLVKSVGDLMSNIKKIMITGNMGYIGPVLTSYLRSIYPGIEIYGIDLGFFGHCLTGAPVIPESRVDIQYISDVMRSKM
jgi:hypothetical protein